MRCLPRLMVFIICLLNITAMPLNAQRRTVSPVFQPVQDDPDLPRVLLLGDSISIGYTLEVRRLLEGRANVHRAAENCGPTTRGIAQLPKWLGDRPWDLIHFNFGLHDLKYIDDQGNRVSPEVGQVQVSMEQYEQNLRQLVRQLQGTGAKLIWCTTTPVPEGADGRVPGDSAKYNQVAARVMRQTLGDDRIINDLYALCRDRLGELQRPADVHFTKEGSAQLAEQVARAIGEQFELSETKTKTARGQVYEDRNDNRTFDEGDLLLAGIRVSNGQQIVTTNEQGEYAVPIGNDGTVFVIKPRGYRTPVDDKQLPVFYYTHKPNGSPPQRFPGVSPTGPLPESIDFPLYPSDEPDQFRAILFGDPQPRDKKELDYIAHDVIQELVGTDASFGVTLGDITFDDLDLFEPQAQMIAVLGIPWYNVIGNHDLNFDAKRDGDSDETFQRVFGPAYYSFDHGPVHFLVLDDVEWLVDEGGEGRYQGGLGRRQMEFIRRDLEMIPPDQLVVLMMHIPLVDVRDRNELYRLIERRPFCMSVSAHTHHHQHRMITHDDGWRGPQPHHHVINVTVSGSWWSGAPDERGIPHTLMADGAPNGYSIVSFDGNQYQFRFKAAGRPADYQMQITAPNVVQKGDQDDFEVYANVFNGSADSVVNVQLNQKGAIRMERIRANDPNYEMTERTERERRELLVEQSVPRHKLWLALPRPKPSSHLWRATVSAADVETGIHILKVTAELGHGDQVVTGRRLIRIEP